MSTYKGKFIVFEGGEGTGKTTQIELLRNRLAARDFPLYVTREPGGTDCPVAEKARNILKDPENIIVPIAEMFFFHASRAQHVHECLLPRLERGDIAISDRFHASSKVYQHFVRGLLEKEEFDRTSRIATSGLIPDLTFLLDIDPAKGLQRITNRTGGDRFDSEKLEFHEKVRQGFLTLAKEEPNWVVIDADQEVNAIHALVWENVSKLLGLL